MSEQKQPPHGEPDKITASGRGVQVRWILDAPEEGVEIHAVLSVSHHGSPTRAYCPVVQITRVEHKQGDAFTDEHYGSLLDNLFRLTAIPAARFSGKGLENAQRAALAELRERADEPEIARFFDPENAPEAY